MKRLSVKKLLKNPKCKGDMIRAVIDFLAQHEGRKENPTMTCSHCEGTGTNTYGTCANCHGTGWVWRKPTGETT